jgi:formylmethanofuran dehydrogenase subunit E
MQVPMSESLLLQAAGRFHGHVGPFLALGLRMGLLANETLGRDPMETAARVAVDPRPPRSCLVDGIQFTTGCTMGKGNIELVPEAEAISAVFTRSGAELNVNVRKDFLRRIDLDLEGAGEKAVIDYAFRIMDTPADELFEASGGV